MKAHAVRVGDKGRLVIPIDLRVAAGVGPGDEMIAHAESGRLLLETREAIKARIREQARATRGGPGVVERLLADRMADLNLEAERRQSHSMRNPTVKKRSKKIG
jgi:bifunctional DNA-binding transcriptional regulator/antitoxin component of YhaV-PrlF toxin-antitoxin module